MKALATAFYLIAAWAGSAAAAPVDLALVFAVDCSSSVSRAEYNLQMAGIGAALRDPAVVAAAGSGPNGRIAINVMTWGEPDYPKFQSGWFEIHDEASAEVAAEMASHFEGRMGGGTGIGNAIGYGITLLETSGFDAERKVIDVSGDGVESGEIRSPRFNLALAQRLRAARGVIVNGLAIENDEPGLEAYYAANVAGGPGSFVMAVNRYEDFARAMRIKLLREVLPATASAAPP
jgi:hypothetical protein